MNISVYLYNGYWGGGANRSVAPWPPPPSQLFSAYANGYYTLVKSFGEEEALLRVMRWLESLDQPHIYYSDEARNNSGPTFMAPVPHHKSGKMSEFVNRGPRKFPSVSPKTPWLVYDWPEVEADDPALSALQEISRMVSHVGASESICLASVSNDLPQVAATLKHLVPDEDGDIPSLWVAPGRMDALARMYEDQNSPRDRGIDCYYSPEQRRQPEPVAYQWGKVYVLKLSGNFKPPASQATVLAYNYKGAVLQALERLGGAPAWFHGHKHPGRHIAVTPLPFVNHNFADGGIMGIAVCVPPGLPADEGHLVGQAINQVESFQHQGYRLGCEPQRDEPDSITLRRSSWIGPRKGTRFWATVTPAALNWKQDNAKQIIDHCRDHLGLPTVERVIFSRHPMMFGCPHAQEYQSRRPKFLLHCVLQFAQNVKGPFISIMAERNYGGGLLAPLSQDTNLDEYERYNPPPGLRDLPEFKTTHPPRKSLSNPLLG